MKNVLLKFAGLFVEKVPVDQQGAPVPRGAPGPTNPPAAGPGSGAGVGTPVNPMQPPPAVQHAPPLGHPAPTPPQAPAGTPSGMVSVALRAWVPQEYAAHLAPFGLHVIAAGGAVTSEQARGWGADVLVVSAECLGQDAHLLQQPQLPTVFITPQPVMIPDVPGVVQVQEPLRASDVAHAAREAAAAFAATRR